MIKLAPRKSFNNWIEMGDGVEFLIDYPTREQQQKLDELMMEMGEKTDMKSPLMLRYARMYIKYTVKDWKGLEVKCKLINNELENSLWEDLTTDPRNPAEAITQVTQIWVKISKELEFTESDKKK